MNAVQISPAWELGSQVAQIAISVKKENAKAQTFADRVMLVRAPFLFLLAGSKVKRVLMINQVERLEVSGTRLLVKATPHACQRDWMLTLRPDGKNTHKDMTSVATAIQLLRKEYGGDLQVLNNITTKPQLQKMAGMSTTAEILKRIKSNRMMIPKRVPPSAAVPEKPTEQEAVLPDTNALLKRDSIDPQHVVEKEPTGVTNGRFTLKVRPNEEDLGLDITRFGHPHRPVRVKGIEPDSAAGRAGIIPNEYIPCYVASLDGVPIKSPDQFYDMVEDKITHNQLEFDVEITEGEPIGATPPPSDSESDVTSSSISEPSTREVYRSNTESTETPPQRHIAKKKKREPFWSDFVASYDAQKRHWDVIEPRVVSLVDSNLEGNTVPIDFEVEAKFVHDSRLTKSLKSRPHDYSIVRRAGVPSGGYQRSSPRYNRYDSRSSGRGHRRDLPGPHSVVDEYLSDSHFRPSYSDRLSLTSKDAYERGYADALREHSSRDSSQRSRGRGEIPRNYRRAIV